MTLLSDLQQVRCFAPTIPFGEQLAAVHVRFDELVGDPAHEERVARIAAAGGIVLVIGSTGEGKSGLASSALSIYDGWLAVPVPVSVPHPEGVTPNLMPSLVLGGFANILSAIDRGAAATAQLASLGTRPKRRVNATVNFKGIEITLGDLLRDRPHTAREQLDAISQAAEACRKGGLTPVLVLDDTDKWASTTERLLAGRGFFDDSLAALTELDLPVVANAHPHYFADHDLPAHVDARVELPRIAAAGVERILSHRVGLATAGAANATDVFDSDARERICRTYLDNHVSIRRIVQIASEALIEADEAGLKQVTIGAVENALAALR